MSAIASPATAGARATRAGAKTAARAGIEPVNATGSSEPARVHLAVDDPSRLACSENFPDETRKSCLIFLFNARHFFRQSRRQSLAGDDR